MLASSQRHPPTQSECKESALNQLAICFLLDARVNGSFLLLKGLLALATMKTACQLPLPAPNAAIITHALANARAKPKV